MVGTSVAGSPGHSDLAFTWYLSSRWYDEVGDYEVFLLRTDWFFGMFGFANPYREPDQ